MGFKIPFTDIKLFQAAPTEKAHAEEPAKEPTPQQSEVGYARSEIYGRGEVEKYDPDDLKIKKGNEVYQKMLTDDQVKPVIQFKKDAVTSREFYFEVGTDENGDPRDDHQEMADFFTYMIGQIKGSFTDNLKGILTSMENGFSISEKIYDTIEYQDRSMWGLKDIKLRPFDSFEGGFVSDEHGNITKINQNVPGQQIEIPLDKIIHFVNDPDFDTLYGRSDLRACYRAWWSKDIAIRFQNIFLERHASGFIWAQVEGRLETVQKTALEAMLRNINTSTGIHVPSNVTLHRENPASTTAFEDAISQHDKAIAKSVLVPNLLGITEQGNTGSYSQSEIQLRAFFWTLGALAKRLEEVLDEQLFRQLALWNFGTEDYPKFKFQPMTLEEAVSLSTTWGDLVQKGAVTQSDTDEAYIRNILGFPDQAEEEEPEEGEGVDGQGVVDGDGEAFDPEAVDPGTALNGAQVAALLDIIAKMGSGELDKKTAIKLIAAAFPMSISEAGVLLSEVQEGKIKLPTGKITPEEFAEQTEWLKRVDFQQLENSLDEISDVYAGELSDIMSGVRFNMESQITKIAGGRSFGNIKTNEFSVLKFPKKAHTNIVKTSREDLKGAMIFGAASAKMELPPNGISTNINEFVTGKQNSESYLSSKSMQIGRDIDNDTLKALHNIILNANTFDWSTSQVMEAIAQDSKLNALWPDYEIERTETGKIKDIKAVKKTGDAGPYPNRLSTIAMHNTSASFNYARQAFFESPENKGFIVAYQYSAIMDRATTPICRALDGRINKDFGRYKPPNHFLCRSVLIPITVIDEWDGKEDGFPSIQPQEGFG